jgi:hypothetical protein
VQDKREWEAELEGELNEYELVEEEERAVSYCILFLCRMSMNGRLSWRVS